ncbi:MAG: DUF2842 domain-containing protein [Parvularculaceae bacterium]
MNPRYKKLIALAVMLPAVTAYFFAAAALGEKVPDIWALRVIYFAVAGVAWAVPVTFLIRWSNAEPSGAQTRPSPINQDERTSGL